MIEQLNDQYTCVVPTYKKGKLYRIGDILLVPHGTEMKSKNFILKEMAKEEIPVKLPEKPKEKKKQETSEE